MKSKTEPMTMGGGGGGNSTVGALGGGASLGFSQLKGVYFLEKIYAISW